MFEPRPGVLEVLRCNHPADRTLSNHHHSTGNKDASRSLKTVHPWERLRVKHCLRGRATNTRKLKQHL